jgi:hypothetical protein
VSTKRRAAAQRRQAQSRRAPGNTRAQQRASSITVITLPTTRSERPTPDVSASPRPLLPPPPGPESFVRPAEAQPTVDDLAAFCADDERDTVDGSANEPADAGAVPSDMTNATWVRAPTDDAISFDVSDFHQEPDPSAIRNEHTVHTVHAPEIVDPLLPFETVSDRFAKVVMPLVAGAKSYAPAWREFFQRSERDWRQSTWYREFRLLPRVLAVVLFIAVASTFAVVVATKAAALSPSVLATAQATPPLSGGIVLQQSPGGSGTPTTVASSYLMGIWPSNASPPPSGSVQIFVRLSDAATPIAGVRVSLSVSLPGASIASGSVKTDGYGLATFTVTYGGAPTARPVYVTASATVNGETVTQQTYFVPQ